MSPPRPVTTTDNVHQVNDQGTVYVVQAGEHFKIGWTTSLEARINALRTGSPLPLRHRRYERGSVHPLLQVRVDVETRDAILASGTSTADFLREAVQEKLAGA